MPGAATKNKQQQPLASTMEHQPRIGRGLGRSWGAGTRPTPRVRLAAVPARCSAPGVPALRRRKSGSDGNGNSHQPVLARATRPDPAATATRTGRCSPGLPARTRPQRQLAPAGARPAPRRTRQRRASPDRAHPRSRARLPGAGCGRTKAEASNQCAGFTRQVRAGGIRRTAPLTFVRACRPPAGRSHLAARA